MISIPKDEFQQILVKDLMISSEKSSSCPNWK